MPNTFGATGQTIQYPLYDPRLERASRRRLFRDDVAELGLANSFYCPAGRWPARGWILMRQADFKKLNAFATNLQLQIDSFTDDVQPLTFKGLSIISARCVSRGKASDPNSIFLVEITDGRGILFNEWFQQGTVSSYNLHAPAYPDQYYTTTLHFGSPFTWEYMVEDLWNQMGTVLGTYPGLPISPLGTPEEFTYPGIPCWDALCQVLDLLGCFVSADLTDAEPYNLVYGGDDDPEFTALTNQFALLKEDDYEWSSNGAGRVPGSVVVLFHRRNQYYGTEETVRLDGWQWSSVPDYAITIPGPAPYNAAPGVHYLWVEFTLRYDVDGNPLPADVTTANNIAQDRVNQFYAKIHRQTLGSMKRLYTGALPFTTGSQVDGVAWRQDFRTNRERSGWTTLLIRGPHPPFPEVEVQVSE